MAPFIFQGHILFTTISSFIDLLSGIAWIPQRKINCLKFKNRTQRGKKLTIHTKKKETQHKMLWLSVP